MNPSLVQQHWVMLCASAIAAVVVPWWLLDPADTVALPEKQVMQPTAIDIPPAPSVGAALAVLPFSATRDPDFVVPQVEGPTPEGSAPAAVPRLVGIVSHRKGAAVALVVGGDGVTQLLKPGDLIDGWQLAGIAASSVLFERNGEKQTIALDFNNKTGAAPGSETPL